MDLKKLSRQAIRQTRVFDEDYIEKSSKEIDEAVKRKIEFEERWNEEHNDGKKTTFEELIEQNKRQKEILNK